MAKTIPIDIGTGTVRSEKEVDALLEQLGLGARVSPLLSMAKTREGASGIKRWIREGMWQLQAAKGARLKQRWYLACLLMKNALDAARGGQVLDPRRVAAEAQPIR